MIAALPMTFLGVPAGYHSIYPVTPAGSGNYTYAEGYVVIFFGQTVYTSIQASATSQGASILSLPLLTIPFDCIAIAFLINLAIATFFLTVLWLVLNLRTVLVSHYPRAKFGLKFLVCRPFQFCHSLHLPFNLRCRSKQR